MSYSIKELSRIASLLITLAIVLGLPSESYAQTGSCNASTSDAYLDVNNVRARILTNGNLFWRGDPYVYEVPKGGGVNAIFAGGFWVAGLVDGQLRTAAARYGNYEFWPGPIDENGNPPANCGVYDKIWKVNRSDVQALAAGDPPTQDLASWPTGLGAPTLAPADTDALDNDADGVVDEPGEMREITTEVLAQPLSQRINRVIDLAAGERPAILGDQTLWWIMNDRGNEHRETETPPIGLEAHAMAFAFNQAGDMGNATFYKMTLFMKAAVPLTQAYVALFSDPDLGNAFDDYVGADTSLGMGYVYNADDVDDAAYGPAPPAAGYDFFQGPIVPSVGDTAHVAGVPVPDFKNLSMTSFVYYNNGGGPNEDPSIGSDYYNYMQARWKDGRPIRAFGDGYNVADTHPTAQFMYAGDPVTGAFWSEFNNDGADAFNTPADRRFVLSSGPFTINPGDKQEIVYGIVWARGGSNLDSVTRMRSADAFAQAAFDANFELPASPDEPVVTFTPGDRSITFEWTNPPTSNNYLDSYREFNPLIDPANPDYVFEGYEVLRFSSAQDQDGQVVATFDVANGVTTVFEDPDGDGIPTQTAFGSDRGIQHSYTMSGLVNYETIFVGVRAYAFNAGANPQVYRSPINRAAIRPAQSTAVISDSANDALDSNAQPDIVADGGATNVGEGSVSADVVNAAVIRDCEYRVEFYSLPAGKATSVTLAEEADAVDAQPLRPSAAAKTPGGETTYDVYCGTEKVFDGSLSGSPAPQRENAFAVDGLEFSIVGPQTDFKDFLVVANGAGVLDPPDMGAYAFNASGFPHASLPDLDRPTAGYQQSTTDVVWGIHAGGAGIPYGPASDGGSFLGRAARGSNFDRIGVYDYEMRFTAAGGLAWRNFEDGATVAVPFELWRTGIATPDDPSDDVRLLAAICEAGCGAGTADLVYDIGGDHGISGGADDPATDWIYWYEPIDLSPGSVGYDAFWADPSVPAGGEILARSVLVAFNIGEAPPYPAELPEEGTVFRLVTTKPSQPGDVFTFSTGTFAAQAPSLDEQKARLKDIGITPNPYKGASAYEVNQLIDEVRFTNLPDVATIRVFTLNGTLLRTLEKNSPGQRSLSWDLTTDTLLPLASGMYLIHVEVPDVGDHVIKFGVVKKRIQLNTF